MTVFRQLPNLLSCSRLLLCPLVIFAQMRGAYGWSVGLFVTAAVTDYLDGYLARRFHLETELGALLDPVCDKLLSLCFFAFLMTLGLCPQWFLGLLLAIVLMQSLGFLLMRMNRPEGGDLHARPVALGKWNTAFQFAWIGVVLTDILLRQSFPRNFQFSAAFHLGGYLLLGTLQIAAFLRYALRYTRALIPDLLALGSAKPEPLAHHP